MNLLNVLGILKKVLVLMGDGFKWALNNMRLALELILVVALLIGGWMYNRKDAQLRSVQAATGQLEEGLKQQITIRNGQIEVLRKENDKLSQHQSYVPPEGYVTIKQTDLTKLSKDYQDLIDKLSHATTPDERKKLEEQIKALLAKLNSGTQGVTVVVKDKGFCLRPGIGVEGSSRGIEPRLDLKWAYFKRYSALLGGSRAGVDISVSRHLDDLIWGHPQNAEFFGGYKFIPLYGGSWYAVGLRLNF